MWQQEGHMVWERDLSLCAPALKSRVNLLASFSQCSCPTSKEKYVTANWKSLDVGRALEPENTLCKAMKGRGLGYERTMVVCTLACRQTRLPWFPVRRKLHRKSSTKTTCQCFRESCLSAEDFYIYVAFRRAREIRAPKHLNCCKFQLRNLELSCKDLTSWYLCSPDGDTAHLVESREEFVVVSMFLKLLGQPSRLGDAVRSPHIASRQSSKGLDLPLCPLPPFCRLAVSLPEKRSLNVFY
ncbi:hypothetical protein QYF61_017685, partial [Mycteria americana]